MIKVSEAEEIIQNTAKAFGITTVSLQDACGYILAENIVADRDLPPYNRVTMDGIAIQHEAFSNGNKIFTVAGTQAAGDSPLSITSSTECIEIMTGAALPESCDTIIRYEDVTIKDDQATINIDHIRKGQNVHYKASDKQQGVILAEPGNVITPAMINTVASVGKTEIKVKQTPKVVIISTGDELVDIHETPSSSEIRRSNSYTIAAVLKQWHIDADLLHITDNKDSLKSRLQKCIDDYDVLILSGGVSMGKYDYLPQVLKELNVTQHFHKIKQRPGKPFWFGTNAEEKYVFAFPGNAVSAFMCTYRYFIPWLKKCLATQDKPLYAVLSSDYTFQPALQYFLQVSLKSNSNGQLVATPQEGNGSGDFINLIYTDAFIELPMEQTTFNKGGVYRIWPYKSL